VTGDAKVAEAPARQKKGTTAMSLASMMGSPSGGVFDWDCSAQAAELVIGPIPTTQTFTAPWCHF